MKSKILLLIIFLIGLESNAQIMEDLRTDLNKIITSKNLTAGISIHSIEDQDTLSINGNQDFPMMSVFKFHIALAVLNQVDIGQLKLNQKFFIEKKDLLPDIWSPILDKFPEGNMYMTLDELLRYTVSDSDNNGCDILLRLIGGTETVQSFINQQGIEDFTIKVNEEEMAVWENLYLNTTTPLATTELLEKFYKGEILKKKTTEYLYQIMVETSRGLNWMKAGLPTGTELAHRTGISNTNEEGLRVAMNNVGIVKLPNGKHLIISIYLKNIIEEREVTEKLLADITKITYDYFTRKL